MLKSIKRFLRTNKLTRGLYRKLFALKNRKAVEEKRKAIQENGVKAVHFLQNLLGECGVDFFFDMGTLLGIIREGNLLKHDLDIDIGVFAENEEEKKQLTHQLQNHGCKLKYEYVIDEIGVVEQSFEYKGIKFDISFYSHLPDADICYLLYCDPSKIYESNVIDVVKLACSPIDTIVTKEFHGEKINVPANAENYLACRYGENWKIPDKNYIYWKGPSATRTDYSGRKMIY